MAHAAVQGIAIEAIESKLEGDIDLKAIDKALKPLEQDLDALMRMNEEIERKIA